MLICSNYSRCCRVCSRGLRTNGGFRTCRGSGIGVVYLRSLCFPLFRRSIFGGSDLGRHRLGRLRLGRCGLRNRRLRLRLDRCRWRWSDFRRWRSLLRQRGLRSQQVTSGSGRLIHRARLRVERTLEGGGRRRGPCGLRGSRRAVPSWALKQRLLPLKMRGLEAGEDHRISRYCTSSRQCVLGIGVARNSRRRVFIGIDGQV